TGAQQLSDGEIAPATSTRLFLGDVNQDAGHNVDAADILALQTLLANPTAYLAAHPTMTDPLNLQDVADINQDGSITNADVQALVYDLSHGVTPTFSSVPEPSTMVLGLFGVLGLAGVGLKRRQK